LEFEGALYHVIARGNEKRAVFRDDGDRQAYLDRLIRCQERFGFRLLVYCLLGNYLHLAIERGATPLSRVMLTLQSSYTQWFNLRHGRVGHLFQGRYKALLVEKETHLLALVRYIHMNPVEAGLVDRPDRYAWSSDRFYRTGHGPEWLHMDPVLSMLGPGRQAATAAYRRFMGTKDPHPYESAPSHAQAIKGDEAFADRILHEAGEKPAAKKQLTEAKIAAAVAKSLGLSLPDMRSESRSRDVSHGRIVAAYLGRAVAEVPVARMARYFGREESTLVRGVLRLEEQLRTDPSSLEDVTRAEADLRIKDR
jgi:REP element-mobilizing transposase RayT